MRDIPISESENNAPKNNVVNRTIEADQLPDFEENRKLLYNFYRACNNGWKNFSEDELTAKMAEDKWYELQKLKLKNFFKNAGAKSNTKQYSRSIIYFLVFHAGHEKSQVDSEEDDDLDVDDTNSSSRRITRSQAYNQAEKNKVLTKVANETNITIEVKSSLKVDKISSKNQSGSKFKKKKNFIKYVCDICNSAYAMRCFLITHLKDCMKSKSLVKPSKTDLMYPKDATVISRRGQQKSTQPTDLCSTIRTKKRKRVCYHCRSSFKSKSRLIKHIENCEKFISFLKPQSETIQETEKRTKDTKIIARGGWKKSNEKSKVCKICKHVARKPCELIIHMRRHTGEKPFACNKCESSFISRFKLNRHLKNYHNTVARDGGYVPDKNKYYCSKCGIYFSVKENYEKHVETHKLPLHQRKPYFCKYCKKRYALQDLLQRHFRIAHTEGGKFICANCDSEFTRKETLVNHIIRKLCS